MRYNTCRLAALAALLFASPALALPTSGPKDTKGAPAVPAIPSLPSALPAVPVIPALPEAGAQPLAATQAPAPAAAAAVPGAASDHPAAVLEHAAAPAERPEAAADGVIESAQKAAVAPRWQGARAAIVSGMKRLRAAFGGKELDLLYFPGSVTPSVPVLGAVRKDGKVVGPEGVPQALRPLTYDPRAPRPSAWRRAVAAVRFIPEKLRRIAAYARQVRALVAAVTDGDLGWSLGRMDALASQEGILRSNNMDLINKWSHGGETMRALGPADFDKSSLSRESLLRTFKTAMDFEEPTLQYQYSFAQKLHNRHPRISHFLGTTLQESVLAVALKGKAGQRSIWSSEEVRHGPILVKVYNATRAADQPPLFEQGTAPRLPSEGTEWKARANMSNRSAAELLAATAYLTIRANAASGSPAQVALDGLFRDEVYHYVIMSALNKFVYGHHSRWRRLLDIVRFEFDDPVPTATDAVIHRRKVPSLLHALETFFALNAIDKRVDAYLRSLDGDAVRRMMGPFYRTDAEVQAAVDRGEHQWTRDAVMEQNPELTREQVSKLAWRFPGFLDLKNRSIKASFLRDVVANYRRTSLRNPDYWLRKKGFELEGVWLTPTGAKKTLRRVLPGDPSKVLQLDFHGGQAPVASVRNRTGGIEPRTLWSGELDAMSLLDIGAFMDADDGKIISRLSEPQPDLSHEELLKRLGRGTYYQNEPIALENDLAAARP